MVARKYDWEDLREKFVEGDPDSEDNNSRTWTTLKELAEREGVPYQAMKQRAAKESWSDARVAYQVELARERQKLRGKELAKEAVDFDGRSLSIAKMGMNLIMGRFAEIAAKHSAQRDAMARDIEAIKQGTIRPMDGMWSAINHKELDSLARAAETLQRMGKTALGEDVIKIQHEGEFTVEHEVTVRRRLEEDDSDRLGRLLAAMEDANLLQIADGIMDDPDAEYTEDIEDADVVEEEDESA